MDQQNLDQFFALTPERVLDAVEQVLAIGGRALRASGRTMALNSMENRVYDIEFEDDSHVVAKFYRPLRWTREQILEEHRFLFSLEAAEIPVVTPLCLGGESLFALPDGISFCLFPKIKGRLRDELNENQLLSVGRYLARMHSIGKTTPFQHRLRLTPDLWAKASLEFLIKNQWIDLTYERRYAEATQRIVARTRELYHGIEMISIHGDCHLGNILWQDEAPFFVDFDDAVTGPPVQDAWMVVRGRDDEAEEMRACLLTGYEEMRDFAVETLDLIEPLRALRMIHYSAWIARRWKDPIFQRQFEDFREPKYWEEELRALEEIERLIR